jgi:hypothetical protein
MSAFDTLNEAACNYGFTWDSFEADLNLAIHIKQNPKERGTKHE